MAPQLFLRLLFLVNLSTFCFSCHHYLPGKQKLRLLIDKRREMSPDAVIVFSAQPKDGERPLAELRQTVDYWSAEGSSDKPRWRGVLQPHPESLYTEIGRQIDAGLRRVHLKVYLYDAIGFDELSLVEYVNGAGEEIGWDYVPYPREGWSAATPLDRDEGKSWPWTAGYEQLEWWEYAQLVLDVPVYVAIGLKELAGEIAKSPLSGLDSAIIGGIVEKRHPFSPVNVKHGGGAVVEDWKNGWSALTFRLRARSRHTPLDLLRDLAGAVPLIGAFVDHGSPPAPRGREDAPRRRGGRSRIVLSQGIHARDATEQFTAGWRRTVAEWRPDAEVTVAPYRYGGSVDVVWSILNISQGYAYDLAERIVFGGGVRPGDQLELVGFSGGVQRSLAATQALYSAGVGVRRVAGVAGPFAGRSAAMENRVLLAANPLRDPVVLTARAVDLFLFPLTGDVTAEAVTGGGRHHTPLFPNGRTRAPEAGYAPRLQEALSSN